jgi:hypothetical protein
MNSHFFVHIADQQLRHYVPVAFQTLQSSRPNPKHQSLGLERTPDHPLNVEVANIAYSVDAHPPAGTVWVWGVVSAELELYMLGHDLGMTAVVGRVPETMKTAGKPEANPGLAVGVVYMQDE